MFKKYFYDIMFLSKTIETLREIFEKGYKKEFKHSH